MTRAALFILSAAFVAGSGRVPAQPPPTPSAPAVAPPAGVLPTAYMKLRVEVEVRGVLRATEKVPVILTRYPHYDSATAEKLSPTPAGAPPYKVELDFTRAKELQELAKTLNGREVVLTGMSELRHVLPPSPPGGFSGIPPGGGPFGYPAGPTWQLHPTVQVTGVRLPAPEKR